MKIRLRTEAERDQVHGSTGAERVTVLPADAGRAEARRDWEVYQTLGDWEQEIRNLFTRGRTSTLELARAVHAAKSRLRHGEWTQLWQSGHLPFSKRKGEMLAVIGKNLGSLNAQTFAHLPAGWSVLHCLAQFDHGTLERLIGEGAVHPSLTLEEAKALVSRFRGRRAPSLRPGTIKDRFCRFQGFIRAACKESSSLQRRQIADALRQLADEVSVSPYQSANQDSAIVPFPDPQGFATEPLLIPSAL